MEIQRLYIQKLLEAKPGKVQLLLGPRRAGKTVILKEFLKRSPLEPLLLNGDDLDNHTLLEPRSVKNYERLLKPIDGLVIDEAQHIPDIGMKLKLMVDEFPEKYFIVSGSSPFDLLNQSGEPLTGRKWDYPVFPPLQAELSATENYAQTQTLLEERMLYGHYPEVLTTEDIEQKKKYLTTLRDESLFKDLLMLEGLKYNRKLYDLLRLLAFQVGSEVSLGELSKKLGWHKNTISRYLNLLQQTFVIFELKGYSGNLRKEVVKSSKYYFLDNGILNAVLGNYKLPAQRNDRGGLWENYFLAERFKFNKVFDPNREMYFWRTYDQQEIDLVETTESYMQAFKIKWNHEKEVKAPKGFQRAYPEADFQLVNPKNYMDWIS